MLLKTQQRNTEQTLERDTRATRARVLIYSTADRYWRGFFFLSLLLQMWDEPNGYRKI